MAAADLSHRALLIAPREMPDLVREVMSAGDAARGEALYRSNDLACLKCHSIAGSGGRVGPDLSGLGSRVQIDYLVESILDDQRQIEFPQRRLEIPTQGLKKKSCSRPLRRPFPRSSFL